MFRTIPSPLARQLLIQIRNCTQLLWDNKGKYNKCMKSVLVPNGRAMKCAIEFWANYLSCSRYQHFRELTVNNLEKLFYEISFHDFSWSVLFLPNPQKFDFDRKSMDWKVLINKNQKSVEGRNSIQEILRDNFYIQEENWKTKRTIYRTVMNVWWRSRIINRNKTAATTVNNNRRAQTKQVFEMNVIWIVFMISAPKWTWFSWWTLKISPVVNSQ